MAKKSRRKLYGRTTGGFVPNPTPARSVADAEAATRNFMKRVKLSKQMYDKFGAETILNHLKSKLGDLSKVEILTGADKLGTEQMVDYAFKQLIPTVDDFDGYEESHIYREDNRIGSNMGHIYKKYLRLTKGAKSDKQMRYAKTLYKSQNWPCFNSQSKKYWTRLGGTNFQAYEALYAQAGEMRQGVYFPHEYMFGASTKPGPAWQEKALYQMYEGRMLTQASMYGELRHYLLTLDDIDWLNDDDNQSASMYYAIDRMTDTVTIANRMKFSPVNLKIYLCKAKKASLYSPAACWFRPDGSQYDNLMRNDYVYPSSAQDKNLPGTAFEPLSNITFYPEASVHLGATPYYSPMFREHWSVERVIKQQILPTDKFELHIERKLRHAIDVRNLESMIETDNEAAGAFQPNDYALLITFRGEPGFMRFQGTSSPVDVDLRETDCTPSSIVVESRSSMGIASQNLFNSDNTPVGNSQENYIAGEGRVLDTEIQTANFSSEWLPEVITNVVVEEGGSR